VEPVDGGAAIGQGAVPGSLHSAQGSHAQGHGATRGPSRPTPARAEGWELPNADEGFGPRGSSAEPRDAQAAGGVREPLGGENLVGPQGPGHGPAGRPKAFDRVPGRILQGGLGSRDIRLKLLGRHGRDEEVFLAVAGHLMARIRDRTNLGGIPIRQPA